MSNQKVSGCWDTVQGSLTLHTSKSHGPFRIAQEQSAMSFTDWVSMAEKLDPSLQHQLHGKCWTAWCQEHNHWTLEHWRDADNDVSWRSVWRSNGWVWLWLLPGQQYMSDCILSTLVWCGVIFQYYYCSAPRFKGTLSIQTIWIS